MIYQILQIIIEFEKKMEENNKSINVGTWNLLQEKINCLYSLFSFHNSKFRMKYIQFYQRATCPPIL